MTPVYQTKFRKGKQRGNCMAACYASFLDLPIEKIPSFVEMDKSVWIGRLRKFFEKHGYNIVCNWIKPSEFEEHYPNDEKPEYSFVSGVSPRGISHLVIFKGDEIFHDPHPDGGGIGKPDAYWYPIKIKQ